MNDCSFTGTGTDEYPVSVAVFNPDTVGHTAHPKTTPLRMNAMLLVLSRLLRRFMDHILEHRELGRSHPDSVILNLQDQVAAVFPALYSHLALVSDPLKPVLDTVLHQRLQCQLEDTAAHKPFGDVYFIIKYILEAEFLDIEIIAQVGDFFFQCDFIPVLNADPQNAG